MRPRPTAIAILAGIAALLCACGSDDDAAVERDPIEARIDSIFPQNPSFGTVDREQVRRMMETAPEDDGPFYMVNFLRHRDRAVYPDGRQSDLSGREAANLYSNLLLPVLIEIGAMPVYVADVEVGMIDDDQAAWTQIGVVRYPSRAKFFEMVERSDVDEIRIHKDAGIEKSLALVANPSDAQLPEFLRRLDLSTVPFPPTPEDPPIAIIHLLNFHDIAQYEDGRETNLTGREAMALYEQGRQDQGVIALGVRPGLVLDIEGEMIGDGRVWDELRINNFPSRATFAQITTAEALDESGIVHREAAIAETYALLTAPMVNEVGYIDPE